MAVEKLAPGAGDSLVGTHAPSGSISSKVSPLLQGRSHTQQRIQRSVFCCTPTPHPPTQSNSGVLLQDVFRWGLAPPPRTPTPLRHTASCNNHQPTTLQRGHRGRSLLFLAETNTQARGLTQRDLYKYTQEEQEEVQRNTSEQQQQQQQPQRRPVETRNIQAM